MRVVILAAGTGSRLGPRTAQRPKCLVELAGTPLLTWQLRAIRAAGITDITIVTGFEAAQLQIEGVNTAHNPRFAETNMVVSLMCARAAFDGTDDVAIVYGDIVYEPRLLESLQPITDPIAVVVDRQWRALWQVRMDDPLADAETLRIDAGGHLTELGGKPTAYDEIEAQYIGMIGVRSDFAPAFVAAFDALPEDGLYDGRTRDQMYMTSFLQRFIDAGTPVAAVVTDAGWIEVDTATDLEAYESLHATGSLDPFVILLEA